jgi:tetratricopeptide (TPR) repeat protein
LRWSILPVALLHTALWIGINADQERALNRLGNQLQRSGYALHNAGVQRHTQADYASAWRNLGLAYRETSAYELSLVAHQTALQSDPSLSDSHYDIGVLYNQLGRHREAVSAYEQMLYLDAGDARARYNLGLTYVQLGEWNAAREQYEKLRGLGSELAKSMAPYLRDP